MVDFKKKNESEKVMTKPVTEEIAPRKVIEADFSDFESEDRDGEFESLFCKTYKADDSEDVSDEHKSTQLPLNKPMYLTYLGAKVINAKKTRKGETYTTQLKKSGSATREALYRNKSQAVTLLHMFQNAKGTTLGIWGNGTLNFQFIDDLVLGANGDQDAIKYKVPVPVEIRMVYSGKDPSDTSQTARQLIDIQFNKKSLSNSPHLSGVLRDVRETERIKEIEMRKLERIVERVDENGEIVQVRVPRDTMVEATH